VREHLDKEGRQRFDAELYDPLPGDSPDMVDSDIAADEMAAFNRLSQEVG